MHKTIRSKSANQSSKYSFTYTFTPTENVVSQTLQNSEPTGYTLDFYYTGALQTQGVTGKIHPKLQGLHIVMRGLIATPANISFKMYINDMLVNSGTRTSMSAGWYFTHNAYTGAVNVGDRISIKLWSSQADTAYDYNAYWVTPMGCGFPKGCIKNFSMTRSADATDLPVFTSAPTRTYQTGCYIHAKENGYVSTNDNATMTSNLFKFLPSDTYKNLFFDANLGVGTQQFPYAGGTANILVITKFNYPPTISFTVQPNMGV